MKTSLLLPAIATFAIIATAVAQKPGDAHEKISSLIEQAKRAKTEGRVDDAKELMEKAKSLEGQLHRQQSAKQEPVKKQKPAPEHEKTAAVEKKEKGEPKNKEHSGHPDKKHAAHERLMHVVEATKHMQAAGFPEAVERLEEIARDLKAGLAKSKSGAASEKPGAPSRQQEEIHANLRDLRAQLEKLAHAVEELRDQVHSERTKKQKDE